MKVLYIHQHFSTPSGAVGSRSYEMAQMLIARGHEVVMVCGRYANSATGLSAPFINGVRRGCTDGINVVEFDLSYSNAQNFVARTKSFLRFMVRSTLEVLRFDGDIVFATTTPLTVAVPGVVAKLIRRKTFVFEVRDLWPELPKAMGVITNPLVLAAMSALEWLGYRSADRLIGLAPGIVDGICRRGVSSDKIALVPNGCDLSLFLRNEVEEIVGVEPDDLVAIYAGTHGRANGLDALLNAAHVAQSRQLTEIKFVLVGSGSEKERLIERAKLLNLTNVIFLPPVPKNRLSRLFARADLGLQCLDNVPAFYRGTSPNKFFDYLSAGLPVLVNYPGWLAEMVVEHDCGYCVPPAESEAFVNALCAAKSDKEALDRKAVSALALGSGVFDRRKLGAAWCDWVIEGVPSQ